MISYTSGKFGRRRRSNVSTDASTGQNTSEKQPLGGECPQVNLPEVPEDTMGKVRRLLGEWWWLWIVAIVFYLSNKK